MELNIPGIHGVGDSLIYFVDRYQRLLDLRRRFRAAAGRRRSARPRSRGMHYFGVVQAILEDRTARLDRVLHGALRLLGASGGQVFRHHAEGHAAREPLPQVLPAADRASARIARTSSGTRRLLRIGLGAPDVRAAVARAAASAASSSSTASPIQPSDKGALTQVYLGGVTFELVVSHLVEPRSGGPMNIDQFGMDTITLAGPLEAKLRAVRDARVHPDHAVRRATSSSHPGRRSGRDRRGARRAACASPDSRCCAISRACRATCTPTRSTSRKAMLAMCRALGSKVLLVCSIDARRTRPAIRRRSCAICASSRCSRCRFGIRDRLRGAVVGHATSARFRRRWDIVAARRSRQPRPRRRFVSTCSPTKTPPRASWTTVDPEKDLRSCSSPISCGRKCARPTSGSIPRGISASFPAKACTARDIAELVRAPGRDRLPRRLQLRGLQRRLRPAAARDRRRARARQSVRFLVGKVSRRSLPMRSKRAAHPTQ